MGFGTGGSEGFREGWDDLDGPIVCSGFEQQEELEQGREYSYTTSLHSLAPNLEAYFLTEERTGCP